MKTLLRLRCSRHWIPAVALCSLALGACSILPPNETPDVYVLPSAAPAAPSSSATLPLAWQLRVDTPEATNSLDSHGIVVLPEPGRITVYKNALWNEPAPILLRERLVDAFIATHQLPAVTNEDDGLNGDFVLAGNLRAFQSEYRDGQPVVVIRYDAQLRRGGSRRVAAARRFEVTVNPSGTAVAQVVDAFGQAADQLAAEVVAWTLDQGQRNWQAPQQQER